ncbi:MAG: STAS domain-containing protein [Chloroflexi bacterium]|nr:MAG: STAS domain-containing protein [Chloroflexota bacterium]
MGRTTFVLDCSALPEADAGQLDGLACLQLSLRRRRCELQLANAGDGLVALIDLAGLAGVLGVEAGGQAEEREEPGRVEEEGQLHDPTV